MDWQERIIALLQQIALMQGGPGPVSASPAGATITADQSGTWFTNEGADAEAEFTLPPAAAGLSFGFVVQDDDGLSITAGSGDTIRVADEASEAAGFISNSAPGSSIRLLAINDTEWVAVSVTGAWAVDPE